MPNISSLTMPDGIVYSIKDSIARKDIEDIKKNSSGSGGNKILAVTLSFDPEGSQFVINKTFAEIEAAIRDNYFVYVQESSGGSYFYPSIVKLDVEDNLKKIIFSSVSLTEDSQGISLQGLIVPAVGEIELIAIEK